MPFGRLSRREARWRSRYRAADGSSGRRPLKPSRREVSLVGNQRHGRLPRVPLDATHHIAWCPCASPVPVEQMSLRIPGGFRRRCPNAANSDRRCIDTKPGAPDRAKPAVGVQPTSGPPRRLERTAEREPSLSASRFTRVGMSALPIRQAPLRRESRSAAGRPPWVWA